MGAWSLSGWVSREVLGLFFIALYRRLIMMASLVVQHGLWSTGSVIVAFPKVTQLELRFKLILGH